MNQWIKKWPFWVWLLLILVLNKLDWRPTGGEEQYLAFAKQMIDPQWIPNSFSLTEFPGTRLLFQLIVGYSMTFMSFEWAVVFWRLMIFSAMAFPLAKIFEKLKINTLLGLLGFQLFITSDQSLLGGEWIFESVEPKAFAYVFVFWGLLDLMEQRFMRAAFFAALSAYFHLMVGGWFIVAIGFAALSIGGLIVAAKSSAVFLACLAPFLWYIVPTYLAKEPELTRGVSTSFIYSYYRLSHHLGIFNTVNYFLDKHLIGSVLTAASFSLLVIYRKWIAINVSKTLWLTATVGFGVSLLFVGIAYVDSQVLNRSGELVKYYPFRLNALASFISLLAVFVFVQNSEHKWLGQLKKYAGLVLALAVVSQLIVNISKAIKPMDEHLASVYSYIKASTPTESVIALEGLWINNQYNYAFTRLTERENYTVYKFVPAEKSKLTEWYRRQLALLDLQRKKLTISEFIATENVQFILTDEEMANDKLDLKISKGKYYLYQVLH